jgi:hypothetical protein
MPAILRIALPIYNLGTRETSRVTARILSFNAWGPFLTDGIVPGAGGQLGIGLGGERSGPPASRDLDDDGAESGERLARWRRSDSTVVLSDSSSDESALPDQPTGEDADASSS